MKSFSQQRAYACRKTGDGCGKQASGWTSVSVDLVLFSALTGSWQQPMTWRYAQSNLVDANRTGICEINNLSRSLPKSQLIVFLWNIPLADISRKSTRQFLANTQQYKLKNSRVHCTHPRHTANAAPQICTMFSLLLVWYYVSTDFHGLQLDTASI